MTSPSSACTAPRAARSGLIGCPACSLVRERGAAPAGALACSRCGAILHDRKPDSLARSWACLLAGLIFYVPANLLPALHTVILGQGGDSTILRGVIDFWNSGSWDIAALIFTASIAVPCTKFVSMGVLLVAAQRRSRTGQRRRARLYRMVELIGYWSMLDVLVVGLVSALVKFRALGDMEPRIGILFFGMVVLLTMLSAMTFDPRLTWDTDDANASE